ncbi:chemotaxis protein CheW [Sphingobium sp. BS19]|uniref:chemotaxis protein CheW n=1 Tax=Sphingobium sp. BS19 TaxID=3018973 RepID=UPI0022EDDCBF|nr:chemotaxis protein CheW [Sphingobium sp. BS19]GLI99068.1 hypothetical protein Sbs19_28860 [Sphingobium sp. BS19]
MTSQAQVNAGDKKIITFKVGDQVFAIDILLLIEVREWEEPTPIPGTSSYVRGVVNLRGISVPILDLSERLGSGRTNTHARSCVLVVEVAQKRAGLLVDEVTGIVTIKVNDIQPAPNLELKDPGAIDGLVQLSANAIGSEASRAPALTVTLLSLEALKVTRELPLAA